MKKIVYSLLITALLSQLGACAKAPLPVHDGPPPRPVDVAAIPNATPKVLARSRYGNPASYVANGKRYYVLISATGYNRVGYASWYGSKFQGHLTSTREHYNMYAMTAASTTLPLPCFARVTNLANGRSVIVEVNDRGPFDKDRILDLSYVAAKKLGYARQGTALVHVTVIDPHTWQQQHQLKLAKPTAQFLVAAGHNLQHAEQLKIKLKH